MHLEKLRSLSKVIGALLIGFVFVLAASVACNRTKKYPLQGEIVSTSVATNEITVKHGDIPGFMPAMAMPYHVKDPTLIQELQPGDKIAAEGFVAKSGDYWLEDVRITDESNRAQVKTRVTPHMLIPGERVPNMAFVNQDGRTIHLSDFSGKALLVTFIYTRCPMPNFCPRLSSQFAKIHDELKKNPGAYSKTHLLTISFDPKYDSPPVLRKYGLAYLDDDASGFAHWDFASTNPADLARMAQAFGLQYEGQDNQIAHTMNIVLIAPDGMVAKLWSTDWTWTELMESVQQTLHTSGQSSELHGHALYGYLCASCHDAPNPDLRKQPPSLHGLFLAKNLPSGAAATDEQVRHTITAGLRTMPAFNQLVTDTDADDIVRYLHRAN
jgi:protein SCO1/2